MADVNKPKLQLRSGLSPNGDKTPSPATKLLISHGKPNFTIQRSPKAVNGNSNPLSPPAVTENNNNEFVVKSTTFNGVFKPSNISAATKQSLPQNGLNNKNNNTTDNEASKVVLRRAKVVPTEVREGEEDENVPEFILRQRRIQERLANQNILDFENRRSGYFTQVMISPSSPNRQSFVETMASPAVKPGLEIPPPAPEHEEDIKQEEVQEQQETQELENVKQEECVKAESVVIVNGQNAEEEEEVAKAIEEVNKAVAGEDDDKTELEETEEVSAPVAAVVTSLPIEEETPTEEISTSVAAAVTSLALEEEIAKEEASALVVPVVTSLAVEETPREEETPKEEVTTKVEETIIVDAVATSAPEESQQNGHKEVEKEEQPQPLQNGNLFNDNEITISHTNGLNSPTLPTPDPTGEKGVNFEPKTVVSFSQELGNDINKYPDTVKVVKENQTPEADAELKELTKLKFEINGNDENIEVKPVLITETATN